MTRQQKGKIVLEYGFKRSYHGLSISIYVLRENKITITKDATTLQSKHTFRQKATDLALLAFLEQYGDKP